MVDVYPETMLEEGFRIGEFLVEPRLQRVTGAEGEVRLEPKVMEVLVRLARQPGRTVSKAEFMDEVWSDTVVSHDALLRCISELRKVFDDDPQAPRYVETIRKRGYRLIAPVSVEDGAGAATSRADVVSVPEAPPAPPLELGPSDDGPAGAGRRGRRSAWAVAAGVLFLAAAGAALWFRMADGPDAAEPLKVVPLTSLVGVESEPSLSPDGTRVAYVWDAGDGGSTEIFVQQVGVEMPLRLTSSPSEERSPSWSPDGLHVAFVRTGGGVSGLYVVPATGGPARQVADLGAHAVRNVAWSPDGRTLAFTVEQSPHGPLGIRLLSLETSEMRQLTRPPADFRGDLELAYSPDGRTLAFTRGVVDHVDDIYVVAVDGGEVKRLTFDHAEITGLDWSADGRSILYSSNREGATALWRIAAAGGSPRWLPTSGGGSGVHQPSVSRRGERLAFMERLQETNVWAYPLEPDDDGAAERAAQRLIASTRWDSNPDVAPGGDRIAFASNRSGSYEIWMCDADGANPVQLTRLGGPFANTPRWSPDGTRLAFAGRDEGSVDVYVVDVAGSRTRRLTTAASTDQAPAWSRDGRWIYFGSNRGGTWEVWKMPADGGDAVQVTRGGGFAAAESADGAHLFYTRRDASGIWRMAADGGGPEALVVDALQPDDWGNWAVTRDGLYFLDRRPEGAELMRYRFDSGATEALASIRGVPNHPSLAVSPETGRFMITRIDRVEGDILLLEDFR